MVACRALAEKVANHDVNDFVTLRLHAMRERVGASTLKRLVYRRRFRVRVLAHISEQTAVAPLREVVVLGTVRNCCVHGSGFSRLETFLFAYGVRVATTEVSVCR